MNDSVIIVARLKALKIGRTALYLSSISWLSNEICSISVTATLSRTLVCYYFCSIYFLRLRRFSAGEYSAVPPSVHKEASFNICLRDTFMRTWGKVSVGKLTVLGVFSVPFTPGGHRHEVFFDWLDKGLPQIRRFVGKTNRMGCRNRYLERFVR